MFWKHKVRESENQILLMATEEIRKNVRISIIYKKLEIVSVLFEIKTTANNGCGNPNCKCGARFKGILEALISYRLDTNRLKDSRHRLH